MSTKSIKLPVFLVVLMAFAGCGKDDKKSTSATASQEAVCSGVACLDSVTWKLLLSGRDYPDRTRVVVNEMTVLDECKSKQQYKIDRTVNPQSLSLDNYLIPVRGQVKIKVIDQGLDCEQENVVLVNEDAQWEEVKDPRGTEIVFHL